MADYRISVDLDNMTIGDLEKLETGKITPILQVFDHIVRLEDVAEEDQEEALRALPWTAINEISESIKEVVDADVDQEVGEKN